MKRTILTQILICSVGLVFSQESNLQLQLRLPVQYDIQKAEVLFTYDTVIRKATAMNFGLDGIINYKINRISFYTGIGFFRNRFNIHRGYDHQALNSGRDSFPIGTETSNYVYSLLRFPLGLSFKIISLRNTSMEIGGEHFFNFSFRRKYNGPLPFDGANAIYNGFNYFGNSFNFFVSLIIPLHNNEIAFEPFTRVYNRYKKDRFLKEKENESIVRYLDSYGISVKYSLLIKK